MVKNSAMDIVRGKIKQRKRTQRKQKAVKKEKQERDYNGFSFIHEGKENSEGDEERKGRTRVGAGMEPGPGGCGEESAGDT